MGKKNFQVIPQMFDIKPVNSAGDLDLERMKGIRRVAKIKREEKRIVASIKPIRKRSFVPVKIPNSFSSRFEMVTPKRNTSQIKNSFVRELNTGDIKINPVPRIFPERSVVAPKSNLLKEKEQLERELLKKSEEIVRLKERELLEEKRRLEERHKLEEQRNLAEQKELEELRKFKEIKKSSTLKDEEDDRVNNFFQKKPQEESVQDIKKCFSEYTFNKKKKREKKARKGNLWSSWQSNWQYKPVLSFAIFLFLLAGVFLSTKTLFYGWQAKREITIKGKNAVGLVAQAQTDFKERDFSSGLNNLKMAQKQLEEASRQLDVSGGGVLSKIPFLPSIAAGKNVLSGGEKTFQAAQLIGQAALLLYGQEGEETADKTTSLKEVFQGANEKISASSELLTAAKEDFDKVNVESLPKEYQGYFEKAKLALTLGSEITDQFEKNYQVFWQIAGFDGPKKYLFLFQNNQEMRATGGFIGSYGVLEMKDGEISNFYIDDIYNPDGQLAEKVVPPAPIQKMSAAWSLHDSNWFPNFPVSAEKAGWFFEKTGGPTVDGIIALTPEILLKILAITGPVEMPEYDTTVDKDNFVEKTQYEVEVDYDKEMNRPKKFIADLAPKILNRLFSSGPEKNFLALVGALNQSLKEKQVLLYSFDYNAQKLISDLGWSGEILNSDKDYLMVVNSNINGYKTDGVVDETISHKAEIQDDGSIINTVKITRKHNGGDTDFDWWNKVNADYMRVYVPKGSQLLSVQGQTREFNSSPLDYDKLGFRRDPQVQAEELAMKIDEESGTRIYEEGNKTVFANWVYVSPQETVEIEYQYTLPFKLDFSSAEGIASYALLAQKQSGSVGSKFSSEIFFTNDKKVVWKYPDSAEILLDRINYSSDLKEDRFWAIVAKKE